MVRRGDISGPEPDSEVALEPRLRAAIGAFSGTAAIAARHIRTEADRWVGVNADRPLAIVSVFKIGVLIEFHRQASTGRLDPEERWRLDARDIVQGSGVVKDLQPGADLTLRDLAVLMSTVSDNSATNVLIDRLGGVDRVNETIRDRLGLASFEVHGPIDFEAIDDRIDRLAVASAGDLAQLMARLVAGSVISSDVSTAVLEALGRQPFVDQFPRYCRYNPYGEAKGIPQRVRVHAKTGFFPGARADAGAIRLPDGGWICYGVIANDSADGLMHPEAEPAVLNAVLGKLVLDAWWTEGESLTVPFPDHARRFSEAGGRGVE